MKETRLTKFQKEILDTIAGSHRKLAGAVEVRDAHDKRLSHKDQTELLQVTTALVFLQEKGHVQYRSGQGWLAV